MVAREVERTGNVVHKNMYKDLVEYVTTPLGYSLDDEYEILVAVSERLNKTYKVFKSKNDKKNMALDWYNIGEDFNGAISRTINGARYR